MNSQLLTPSDVSDILKINYRKVLELILLGVIPAYQVGRQYRISQIDLNNYLSKNKVKGFTQL